MSRTAKSQFCLALLCFCISMAVCRADDNIGWRGDGSGLFPDAKPPMKFAGNIRWKTEVGSGMSSPIVVGDRVFITAEPDLLVCMHRDTGKLLWKKSTGFDDLPKGEKIKPEMPPTECGYATPTPVSDGKRVAVVFGTGLVACYDLEGKRLWIRHLRADRLLQYGRSSSPVIANGRFIVQVGCVQALDLQTGQPLWKADKAKEGYGSPLVTRIGGVPVLVTGSGDLVRVDDGKVLISGLGRCESATPISRGRVVYFIDAEARAVELPEKLEDAIKVKELWKQDLLGDFYASPIVHDRLIHAVNSKGLYFVLDAAMGKIVLEKDLNLPEPEKNARSANCYPSLTLAGTQLFLGGDGGGSLWLKPGRTYTEVGRNLLAEGSAGTPAFAGGLMFLRGGAHLQGFGEK